MWVGVTMGFALMKFSGSINRFGVRSVIRVRVSRVNTPNMMSLMVKYGCSGTMSRADENPVGLLDPDWCSVARCTPIVPMITNGMMKCNVKSRVRVGSSTEKPPQIHSIIDFPIYGIVEMRLVITVAAQNDICPHGRI